MSNKDLKTLEQLIKRLFKTQRLNEKTHFDVWVCGKCGAAIDKENPLACCHFFGYEKSDCATDVYRWLKYRVENYEFEKTETPEYHLFVKLAGIENLPEE